MYGLTDRPSTTQPNIPLRRLCHRRHPPSTASNDSHEPIRKLVHDMPRLCALKHGKGSDNYTNVTKPQAVYLRLKPVGTRRTASGGDR